MVWPFLRSRMVRPRPVLARKAAGRKTSFLLRDVLSVFTACKMITLSRYEICISSPSQRLTLGLLLQGQFCLRRGSVKTSRLPLVLDCPFPLDGTKTMLRGRLNHEFRHETASDTGSAYFSD